MNSVYKVSIELMLKQGYRIIRQNKTLVNKSVAMIKMRRKVFTPAYSCQGTGQY